SDPHLVWLLVPEPDGEGSVRCTTRTPDAEHVALRARWGVSGRGWWLRAELPLSALQPSDDDPGTEAVAYPAAGAAEVPDLEAPRRAADSVPPSTGRDALAFRMDVLVNEISRD